MKALVYSHNTALLGALKAASQHLFTRSNFALVIEVLPSLEAIWEAVSPTFLIVDLAALPRESAGVERTCTLISGFQAINASCRVKLVPSGGSADAQMVWALGKPRDTAFGLVPPESAFDKHYWSSWFELSPAHLLYSELLSSLRQALASRLDPNREALLLSLLSIPPTTAQDVKGFALHLTGGSMSQASQRRRLWQQFKLAGSLCPEDLIALIRLLYYVKLSEFRPPNGIPLTAAYKARALGLASTRQLMRQFKSKLGLSMAQVSELRFDDLFPKAADLLCTTQERPPRIKEAVRLLKEPTATTSIALAS